ncbi:protein transport protein Sec24D-like [Eurosta solidaginis]|uniref:protein transport protein Sec24D-like n=1 Tax=Eurosta solidaginis TaxID=178769 RepID=UPI0035310182
MSTHHHHHQQSHKSPHHNQAHPTPREIPTHSGNGNISQQQHNITDTVDWSSNWSATQPTSIAGCVTSPYQQTGEQQMPPQLGPMTRQSGLMQSPSGQIPPQHRMHQQFCVHEQHGPPGIPPASIAPGGAMTPHPVMPRYIPQQQPGYAMPRQQQQQPPQPGYLPMPQQPGYPPQPGYPQQPGYPLKQPGAPGGYMGQMMPTTQYGQAPMLSQPRMPGQPPILGRPGYNQLPAPGTGIYQQPQQYDQAQRRLDPDQMPNPISVIIENQHSAGSAFTTNEQGLLSPLVTTKYVVQDQGNSSPRYVRSSLYCIPAPADLLKTTALSIPLTVSPIARTVEGEYEPPIVNFDGLGPIRCNRCKAHICNL